MEHARPLRADAERNRRKIVEAAIEVIGRRGVDAAVEEIAREAGVGRGTLYRRFATKEELVRSIILDRTELALAAMEDAAAEPEAWAALTGTIHALAGHLAGDRGLFDTLTRGGSPVDVVPERPVWFLAVVDPVLARAQAQGIVREDVSSTDLVALAAAVSQIVPGDPASSAARWERYLAIALRGVRAGDEPLPHRPPARPPRIR